MINLGNIEIADLRLGASQVKALCLGSEQVWSGEEPGPVADWLCFTAVDAGATICLQNSGGIDASFMTSTDGKTWTDYTFWTTITLENVGDKVYFRAKDENTTAFYTGYRNYLQFQTTAGKRIAASGNIMTLLKADGSKTDITNNSQFRGLFQNCSSLTTAPELPATTCKRQCYDNMFEGCTSLSYIKVGFTDWRISGILSFTDSWLNNVAATGTFICPATLDTSTRGPSRIPASWTVVQPLTFVADQANTTFNLRRIGSPDAVSLEYSYDGETWDDYTWNGNSGKNLELQAINDKVYLRAKTENATISKNDSNYYYLSLVSGKYSVSGNIQTLLKADGSRTDAPAYCYYSMFANCKTTTAPTLPATTLANRCYYEMFSSCSFLTAAPALPATTLAEYCYASMFNGCTALTAAPALLATTLATGCYSNMFNGCTALTSAPALPATTLASSCYQSMFYNCTSLTTAPSLPATTLDTRCYQYMFNDCTSLTSAPALPATTLVSNCYAQMFRGCTSLSSVEVAFTSWSGNATANWLQNVAASGTFTCPAELPDTRDASHIPTNWTVAHPAPAATPLCFTAEGNNASVALMHGSSAPSITMEYSLNNETWDSYTLGTTVTLASKGDKVYFRAADVNAGMGYAGANNWQSQYNNWFDCQNVSVSGKIVSVLRKDIDESLTYTDRDGIYRSMLRNYNSRNPQIVSAKDLQLPQLSSFSTQAFMGIFANSTLSAAPALPTNCSIKKETFAFFFENCDKLSSIDSPMMTITGFSGINNNTDSPFNNTFTGMNNFNQEELVLVLSGISDYPNYCLAAVFEGNTSFTGKFIIDMTSYTSVPTIQSNTFNNNTKPANGTLEIHVPASLYDTWKNATNWTTWSSYIVPVS